MYQDLDSTQKTISNVLDISLPAVRSGLVAIYDKNTWFVTVANITTCFYCLGCDDDSVVHAC